MHDWAVLITIAGLVLLVGALLFLLMLLRVVEPPGTVVTPDDPWDKRLRAWLRGPPKAGS